MQDMIKSVWQSTASWDWWNFLKSYWFASENLQSFPEFSYWHATCENSKLALILRRRYCWDHLSLTCVVAMSARDDHFAIAIIVLVSSCYFCFEWVLHLSLSLSYARQIIFLSLLPLLIPTPCRYNFIFTLLYSSCLNSVTLLQVQNNFHKQKLLTYTYTNIWCRNLGYLMIL